MAWNHDKFYIIFYILEENEGIESLRYMKWIVFTVYQNASQTQSAAHLIYEGICNLSKSDLN